MKSIGIIDHVGSKAGMDLYSYSLLDSLHKKGLNVVLFSNFHIPDTVIPTYNYFIKTDSNLFCKAYTLIIGYVRSYLAAKRGHLDVIILHVFSYSIMDLFSFVSSRVLGFKTFAIVHDVEPFESVKYNNNIIKYFMLNYLSDRIIVHNKYSFQLIEKSIRRSKKSLVKIIKQGAYTETLHKIHSANIVIPPELNLKKKFILFFGQIKYEKGLDILLSAMPHINKDYCLVVAGRMRDINDDRYMEIVIKENIEDRIIYLNRYISDEEKNYLFQSAEIIVIPYKKVFQSGVLLTAMSYGKIIVASDLVPNLEIIRNGENGFIFQSENIIDLSRIVNQAILLDERAKDRIRKNAYSSAKNEYSWYKIANEYSEMLKLFSKG